MGTEHLAGHNISYIVKAKLYVLGNHHNHED